MRASVPTVSTVVVMVAGRGGFRVTQYLTGLALLALWGPHRFGGYAAAVGASAWLLAFGASGIERAAVLAVTTVGWSQRRPFAILAALPVGLGVLAAGVVALGTDSGADAGGLDYSLAATTTAAIAASGVYVALFRVRGAPYADPIVFTLIGLSYLLGLVLVARLNLGVTGLLATLCAVAVAVSLALYLTIARRAPDEGGAQPRGGVCLLAAGRSVLLLCAGDVLGMLGVSALYLELAPNAAQTSLFFVLTLVSSAVSVLWGYLLRIWQPRIVASAAAWLSRVRGWLLASAGAGLVLVVGLLAVMLAGSGRRGVAWPSISALAIEISLFIVVTLGAFVLESLGGPAQLRSALTALTSLPVVALTGYALVPSLGAAGALLALSLGLIVRAVLLRLSLRRPGSEVSAPPKPAAGRLAGAVQSTEDAG